MANPQQQPDTLADYIANVIDTRLSEAWVNATVHGSGLVRPSGITGDVVVTDQPNQRRSMSMSDNLADICGLDRDGDDARVVSFQLEHGKFWVAEENESYFGVRLEVDQVELLIAYLQHALTMMEVPS